MQLGDSLPCWVPPWDQDSAWRRPWVLSATLRSRFRLETPLGAECHLRSRFSLELETPCRCWVPPWDQEDWRLETPFGAECHLEIKSHDWRLECHLAFDWIGDAPWDQDCSLETPVLAECHLEIKTEVGVPPCDQDWGLETPLEIKIVGDARLCWVPPWDQDSGARLRWVPPWDQDWRVQRPWMIFPWTKFVWLELRRRRLR